MVQGSGRALIPAVEAITRSRRCRHELQESPPPYTRFVPRFLRLAAHVTVSFVLDKKNAGLVGNDDTRRSLRSRSCKDATIETCCVVHTTLMYAKKTVMLFPAPSSMPTPPRPTGTFPNPNSLAGTHPTKEHEELPPVEAPNPSTLCIPPRPSSFDPPDKSGRP